MVSQEQLGLHSEILIKEIDESDKDNVSKGKLSFG